MFPEWRQSAARFLFSRNAQAWEAVPHRFDVSYTEKACRKPAALSLSG
ncbi:hypothetical protein K788_0001628 (plasmid) [Paraburkholderia caribensis MBA4]|uniref:Uncharacterized protein n=1 Tax=Paraburkholderia caribensis MBA4 TaxID=1323664 RepID=A0A0P0RMI8_9BURK|nr:hypothetical protein K788_0001628 [Paraburkholderia caribensis MBA4]